MNDCVDDIEYAKKIKLANDTLRSNKYMNVLLWLARTHTKEYFEYTKIPNSILQIEFIDKHRDKWIKQTKKLRDLVSLLNLPQEQSKESVPETVKTSINTFINKLSSLEHTISPQTKGIIQYAGMSTIVNHLFYIRLIEKYKNDCILPFMEMYNVFFDNTMSLKQMHTIANAIVNCIIRGTKLFIIPLRISFVDSSHANMLIYRVNYSEDGKMTHVIEHFEPHGAAFYGTGEDEDLAIKAQDRVLELLETIKEIYEIRGLSINTEYISPREVCPVIKGIQYIHETINKITESWGGFCGIWSFLFAELTILNPTVSSRVLYKSLIEVSSKDTDYLNKILIGYIINTSNDLFEMFGKIFGIKTKKDIIKLIGRVIGSIDEDQKKIQRSNFILGKKIDEYITHKYMESQGDIPGGIDETERYLDKLYSENHLSNKEKNYKMYNDYLLINTIYNNKLYVLKSKMNEIKRKNMLSYLLSRTYNNLKTKYHDLKEKVKTFNKRYRDLNVWGENYHEDEHTDDDDDDDEDEHTDDEDENHEST